MIRALLILSLFLTGCANLGIESRTKLLYANEEFMGGDITVDKGCSMVISPIVYKREFLQTPSIETLAKPLSSRHDFLKISSLEDAAATLPRSAQDSLLQQVPQAIKESDILGLGALSPQIRKCGIAFFQTIHITNMAKVITASGGTLRKLSIQIEVWDSEKQQALWRAEADTRTLNERLSDEEVIMLSIKELYQLLPKFYFNTVHETW